jgi:hypothetical protein
MLGLVDKSHSARVSSRNLSGGTRDVEPLVDAGVNWCWRNVLVSWDVELGWVDTVGAVLDADVGTGDRH